MSLQHKKKSSSSRLWVGAILKDLVQVVDTDDPEDKEAIKALQATQPEIPEIDEYHFLQRGIRTQPLED